MKKMVLILSCCVAIFFTGCVGKKIDPTQQADHYIEPSVDQDKRSLDISDFQEEGDKGNKIISGSKIEWKDCSKCRTEIFHSDIEWDTKGNKIISGSEIEWE